MTRTLSLLLAAWLGAGVLFAASVAPAAFAVLPSRSLAGELVGRVLPVIFVTGIVIALLGLILDRSTVGRLPRVRRIVLVAMALACASAHYGIAPRIEQVRREIPGAIEQLPVTDPRRVAFGRLHAESVAWLGVAMIGALSVIILASMSPRSARDSAPDPLVALPH